MKSFKNLLGILVVFSVLASCPIFGMDFGLGDIHGCDDKEEAAECVDDSNEEGVLQRCFFGPGSWLRGLHGYHEMLHERGMSDPGLNRELFLASSLWVMGGCLFAREALRRMMIGNAKHKDFEFSLPLALLTFSSIVLSRFPYEDVSVIRNIQRAQAGKYFEDEDIKRYMRGLLDIAHIFGIQGHLHRDLRVKFFEHYREKRLAQLQNCAEQVLIERGACIRRDDNSGIECVGDTQVAFGPIVQGVPAKFRLLRTILQNNEAEENVGEQDIEERLNILLGYAQQGRNKKKSR